MGCRSRHHPPCDARRLPACPIPCQSPGSCRSRTSLSTLAGRCGPRGSWVPHCRNLRERRERCTFCSWHQEHPRFCTPLSPKQAKLGVKMQLAAVSNFIYLSIYLFGGFFHLYLCMHTHIHTSQSSATAVQWLKIAHVPGKLLCPGDTAGTFSFPALLYKHRGHNPPPPSKGSTAAELPVRPQGGQDPLPQPGAGAATLH